MKPVKPMKPLMRVIVTLAAALLALVASVSWAMPIPFGDREVQLTAREQPIAAFLQDLFGRIDIPVAVSPTIKGAVNGSFAGPAERTWRSVSRAFNVVEYYDGSVLYIYSPADMATRTLPVSPSAAARVLRTVTEMRLPDTRNTLKSTREGTLIASGTRRFIEQVEEIARAQLVSDRTGTPTGFKVFYLRYAWAQDVNIAFGGRQVMLPGVASIVRALMTSNAKSQVSVTSYETPAMGTVASVRGQRSPRGLPTLGGPDANPNINSAPVVAAAGLGANTRVAADAGTLQNGANPPLVVAADPSQVRVEADARLNAVVVRDTPERLEQYEQLIAALDVEPQALEIEATIIDLNIEKLREIGINWRGGHSRWSLLFGNGTSSDLALRPNISPTDVTPSGTGGYISAVLGGANEFIARINLLQTQGAAKVVSSPQVLTLSNVEAVFDNSRTFFVRVAGRDDVDLFNVSAGTTLRVTPHVFKDNNQVRIKMLVSIEDGSLSATQMVDTLPVVQRSAISTQALIFEGESLLVGGIVRESNNDDVTKVPVLGDLPLIGGLFRSTAQGNARVERLFLIQPRLSSGRRSQAPAAAAASAPAPAPAASAPPAAQPPAAPPPASAPALQTERSRAPFNPSSEGGP